MRITSVVVVAILVALSLNIASAQQNLLIPVQNNHLDANSSGQIEALLTKAKASQDAGDFDQAIATYRQILALPNITDEWSVPTRYALAGLYFDQNKVEAARALAREIIGNPKAEPFYRYTAQLAVGASYQRAGEYDRARKEFSVLVGDSKVEPAIRFVAQSQIGATYFNEEKWDRARSEYVKSLVIKDVPIVQRAEAMSQIVQTYEKQFGRARALNEVTQFHKPLLQEAQRLFDAEQWEPARDYYAALIAVGYWNPSVVWGFQEQIAETYLGQKNWEESRKLLNSILEAQPEPNWPQSEREGLKLVQQLAQFTLAQSYFQEGDSQRAKTEFEKLLQIPDLNAGLRSKAEAALKQLK